MYTKSSHRLGYKSIVIPGRHYLRWCKTTALVALVLLGTTLISLAQTREIQQEYRGAEAAKLVEGAKLVLEGNQTNIPAYIIFKEGQGIAYGEFLGWMKDKYRLNADIDFQLISTQKDQLGFAHDRYQQTYKGVPIDRATFVIQIENGVVTSFSGNIHPLVGMTTNTSISHDMAVDIAKKHVGASQYMWDSEFWENDLKAQTGDLYATYYPEKKLFWARTSRSDNKSMKANFRLAYELDMNPADHHTAMRVYVDANTGAVINSYPIESNCDATTVTTIFNGTRTIRTEEFQQDNWRLLDDCTSSDMRVRDWNTTNPNNPPANPLEITDGDNLNWANTTIKQFGATVLWQCRESRDYFAAEHSIDSYDDSGGDINGFVDAWFSTCTPAPCSTRNNASMSFTGGRMKVGMSSAGTLTNSYATVDIIGHEYVHAVTGASSALTYQDESGALNESFSDILGEAIERETLGANDWLMGAERDNGRIRDIMAPKNANDPDTYLGTNWAPTGAAQPDNGGVHTNSGVQNFWFYLLVTGGSGTNDNGDDYDVSGIGFNKAEDIAFRNLWVKLSNGSNYAAARVGAIDAAEDLYGACSPEVKAVMDAWHAVGVGDPFLNLEMSVETDYNGQDISCFGECDGLAQVVVDGSNPPYDYEWSNGDLISLAKDLCAGTATVTVTDNDGCTATASITLTEPDLMVAIAESKYSYNGYGVRCFGGSDGGVEANPTGGTAPFQYLWNTGDNTQEVLGLPIGTYYLSVADANGCFDTDNVTLTQPTLLEANAAATSDYNGYNISCNGGNDGTAEAFPTGGVPGYDYLWDDFINSTTKSAIMLTAGTYKVTVTDANYCEAYDSVTLTEPDPLEIDAGDNYTVYFGYPDSACATLTYSGVSGGVPPYVIEWSTGENTTSIEVCPDSTTTYYVTITDANNCVLTDSAKVCVIDVRCGVNLDKILICHAPPENPTNTQTMCVGFNAAVNHFKNHGHDQLAECGIDKSCEFDGGAKWANNYQWKEHQEMEVVAYPNPFQNKLTINFTPGEDGEVQLRVFDINGKELTTLFHGRVVGGQQYIRELNTSLMAEGMYFYKLETSDGHESVIEKITLIR